MNRYLTAKSITQRKNVISVALLAYCAVGAPACSSSPEADGSGGSKSSAGGGGAVFTTGGSGAGVGSNTGVGSTNGGDGDSDIDIGDGDGDVGSTGSGGVPAIQDGGIVALTPEQATTIEEAECADVTGEADKLPAALQFVVDVSGSMSQSAPSTEPLSKWGVTLPALLLAVDGIDDNMAVGLQLFPTSEPNRGGGGSVDYCADDRGRVPITALGMAGSPHRTLLANELNTAPFYNVTPTHDGYVNALEASLKPYQGTGNKFMVLMTDGIPTQAVGCGPFETAGTPTDAIIASVAAAYAEGISTFIIGSPGTEGGGTDQLGNVLEDTRPWLSAAAMAGGTAVEGCAVDGPNFCHLDMTTATDLGVALSAALDGIADKVAATCSFEVPTVADKEIDPALTNVMINWSAGHADLVMHDNIGACTEGWVWGPNGEIELCPDTCTQVETDAGAVVTVSLGCTVEQLIPTVQ